MTVQDTRTIYRPYIDTSIAGLSVKHDRVNFCSRQKFAYGRKGCDNYVIFHH